MLETEEEHLSSTLFYTAALSNTIREPEFFRLLLFIVTRTG